MNIFITEQLTKYKVEITTFLSLLLFLKFRLVIRLFDYTAASIDAGILSALFLVMAAVPIFVMMANMLVAQCWPVLNDYAQDFLERTFKTMESWQKVAFYMAFYLGLLYAFVLTLGAVV